jgi:hypothetical protein
MTRKTHVHLSDLAGLNRLPSDHVSGVVVGTASLGRA